MIVSELVDKFADAIAYAEGFYVTNSRAWRNNNPGNLTLDITGTGIGKDGMFIIYASANDGWDALKKQVRMMIDGTSGIYDPNMSISEIASFYTLTQPTEWARNVATRLGVSVSDTLNDLLTLPVAGALGGIVLAFFALLYYIYSKNK